MPTYKTQGIIIKRSDLGEADRLLTIYSREHGKIKAVAKSARKPTSRKAGHLELLNVVNLFLAQGRSLDIITQAKIRQSFKNIRDDLTKTSQAFYVFELIDRFTEERQSDQELFALLQDVLAGLDIGADSEKNSLLLRAFELKLLTHLGFAPRFAECVSCGTTISQEGSYQFDLSAGGLRCKSCARQQNSLLSADVIKLIRFLQQQPLEKSATVKAPTPVQAEAERVLQDFVRFTLERELKTTSFLNQVQQV